jgi:hypothetical protein
MRVRGWIAGAVCILFGVLAANCGTTSSGFGDAGNGSDGGEVNDSTTPPQNDSGFTFGDVSAEAAPPCQGLQCQVQNCGGSAHTTISGTVYDPAGNNPLYNILVYIPTFPSNPLPTISHGMSCDTCAAKIDNAMATALTDAKGHFTITDAPVGQNIPIVVQVGKWRRKYTIPTVNACVDNVPFPTSNAPANRLRLPAKQSEGDMPLIAYATGCDPMDSLLKKIGIDAAEFTAENKGGMVEVYQGNSSTINPPGSTSAYTFWNDVNAMERHDIVINACECSPYPRNNGYANLDTYLNGGGRFFGSHYHINFFADSSAAADLKSAGTWNEWGSCGTAPYDIDTTFPKGKAMADWMNNIFPTAPYGQVAITSGCMVQDIHAATSGIAQQWIYENGTKYPGYISINTPTTKQPQDRCGRAVLTDLHVGTTGTTLEQQEAALEFMFFDLAACVQSDSSTPQPPSPN